MRTTEILGDVENAIKNRKPSGSGKWFIMWKDGKIVCVPTTIIPQPEVTFGIFSHEQAQSGFTAKQWSRIFGEVHGFLKQKGLR